MTAVLVTGVSGTGKSFVLEELARRGYRVVDTDYGDWSEWVTDSHGEADWIWHDARMTELLSSNEGVLFVSGCRSNQAAFYQWFDSIVLLTAPAGVVLERVSTRTNNGYGKSNDERAAIVRSISDVEPLLRTGASVVIDATLTLIDVADRVEGIATGRRSRLR